MRTQRNDAEAWEATVRGFGQEWSTFDQSRVDERHLAALFDDYFAIFPWQDLGSDARGVDIGCGTGRWAQFVAPRVGALLCIDASPDAARVARRRLATSPNVLVSAGTAESLPVAGGSLDFGYAIGVLHHTPDTRAALAECVRALRPGAPLLVYLYYDLDGRPGWYRALWGLSNAARHRIARLPFRARYWVTQTIAALVYWPLARTARVAERLGASPTQVSSIPLGFYRDLPFYTMRNDALDRFGTVVEQRFSRREIVEMLEGAGLRDVRFSPDAPYWCAVGWVE